jgi:solute carrier family 45 protein 1/2/4
MQDNVLIGRTVQACCRSLIVDTLPIPKQQSGSAWASRMVSVGHLIGYIAGTYVYLGAFPLYGLCCL